MEIASTNPVLLQREFRKASSDFERSCYSDIFASMWVHERELLR